MTQPKMTEMFQRKKPACPMKSVVCVATYLRNVHFIC